MDSDRRQGDDVFAHIRSTFTPPTFLPGYFCQDISDMEISGFPAFQVLGSVTPVCP